MDVPSTKQPDGDQSCKSVKQRRRGKNKQKAADKIEQSDYILNDKVLANISTGCSFASGSITKPMGELQPEASSLTENISVSKARKKKKRKKTGRTLNDAEILSVESKGLNQLLNCSKASVDIVDDKAVTNLPKENVLEFESVVQATAQQQGAASVPAENISELNETRKKKKRAKKKVKKLSVEDGAKRNDQVEIAFESTDNLSHANVSRTRKRKRKSIKKLNSTGQPGRSSQIEYGPSFGPNSEPLSMNLHLIPTVRRKLVVFDVNGLLVDIVQRAPKHRGGYTKINGLAIFWRPYCKEFLQFCLQNFDVGIWSSRSRKFITGIVRSLLGSLRGKLKIVWDRSHCTKTKFNTLDNKHKPIVCKELRKIWESNDPKMPWKKGDYDESNTLLLDDSPYKALLNPLHTAVFPQTYRYVDKNDDSLGPNGDLRNYLKGLLSSDNVRSYVKEHPFGQEAITEKHESWESYAEVIRSKSNPKKR